jgi:sulfite exporter TauE/SafE
MIPYLIDKRCDWKHCLRLAIIFNAPRIVILTLVGACIGFISFNIARTVPFRDIVAFTGAFGYVLLGTFMLGFGAYMLARSFDEKADRTESIARKKGTERGKLTTGMARDFLQKLTYDSTKGNRLFFIWGSILSIACLGEVTLIEGAIVSGIAGLLGIGWLSGIVFGAFAMFIFATGATMPVLIVTLIGGTLSERISSFDVIYRIKVCGGILMILIALVLILSQVLVLRNAF